MRTPGASTSANPLALSQENLRFRSSQGQINRTSLSFGMKGLKGSQSGPRRFLDYPAAFGPVLESAEIIDPLVAHVFEHLAGKRGAPARTAIEDHGVVLFEVVVVVGRIGIGAKLQHAARDIEGAGDLAALFDFGRVPHVDDKRFALSHRASAGAIRGT